MSKISSLVYALLLSLLLSQTGVAMEMAPDTRILVTPECPTLNDAIQVRVMRSKPKGELRWGINASHEGWTQPAPVYRPNRSIETDDGVAVDSLLPPPDSNGISSIILGPFNSGEQVVTSLNMAVHWGDDWDINDGKNYNVPISLTSTNKSDTLHLSTEVNLDAVINNFTVICESKTPVALWLNGNPLVFLSEPPYVHSVNLQGLAFGKHHLSARNGVNGDYNLAQLTFWHVPKITKKYRPLKEPFGATLNEDGTTTFVLYAPRKHFISVVGDFNQWDPSADLMNYSTNNIWWLTRPIKEGTYHYQYLLDGEKLIADPYATDVTWQDDNGKESYKTAEAKVRIEVGKQDYSWQDNDFIAPSLNELIIYELFIQDVCPDQGYTGLVQRLDYIRDLGVNAIEVMPWNEFTGDHSWGYNPAFHFAPETTYGTPDELKQLIDEAHQRGLAVIMDVVLNHMESKSPLFQLYEEDYDASPYFHKFDGDNWGFPDLDQKSEAVKRYAADVMRFWIEEYHIDGFRYDATRWVDWHGYNDWGASWFAYAGNLADSNSYQIAEHLPADPALIAQTEMDTGWDSHFRWRISDMLRYRFLEKNEIYSILQPVASGNWMTSFDRVVYTESHDEERGMRDFIEEEHMSTEEAVRRCISAMALTLTAPGIPMIYAGQEFGERTKKVVGDNHLNWQLLEKNEHQFLYQATKKLIHLRARSPALQSENIEILPIMPEKHTVIFRRLGNSSSQEVVVAINFGKNTENIELPITPESWKNILQEDNTMFSTVRLLPGQALVLEKVAPPSK